MSYTELGNTIPGKEFNFLLHLFSSYILETVAVETSQKYELTLSHQ